MTGGELIGGEFNVQQIGDRQIVRLENRPFDKLSRTKLNSMNAVWLVKYNSITYLSVIINKGEHNYANAYVIFSNLCE